MNDADIVAKTIAGEARGEGNSGMQNVACVVMNRVNIAKDYVAAHGHPHPLFGDGTPGNACLVPWQFSCWNEGDPNRAIIETLDERYSIYRDALTVAVDAIHGDLDDLTRGATHYYDRRMPTPPAWAEGKSPCYQEGHHLFFNDIA